MANSSSAIAPLTAQERAQRSVFVGNIPYEATEEQLKEIFLQAGPVVSFRLVYDRETGKPKGYGFCEYQDVDTAQSAMRNLNNHDFSGRPLRVGVAAGEQNKDDVKNMQGAIGVLENPYGDAVEPAKAPEAISKAVASLPPEQMFELMKQMKLCIQNNPNEARNMLLENPQLAYALLQAQIVMKIVDPQVAIAMLHRQTDQIPPLLPSTQPPTPAPAHQHDTGDLPGFSNLVEMEMNRSRAGGVGGPSGGGPPAPARGPYDEGPSRMGPNGPPPRGPPPSHRPDMHRDDMHGGRPDMMGVRGGVGPRGPPPGGPQPHGPPPRRGGPPGPHGGPPPEGPYLPPGGEPPRHGPRPHGPPAGPPGPKPMGPPGGHAAGPPGLGPDVNKEKTSLIMQVLRLSPEQIEMLPPDQRQSIMVLKEQISRSGTRPQ